MYIEQLNGDINRWKAQIAAIYDMPMSKQKTPEMEHVLQIFQDQLKSLLDVHDDQTKQIQVVGATVFSATPRLFSAHRSVLALRKLAQETIHLTVQETQLLNAKC